MIKNVNTMELIKKFSLLAFVLGVGMVWSVPASAGDACGNSCGETCCDVDSCFSKKKSWCSGLFGCCKKDDSCCDLGCADDGCGDGCGDACGLGGCFDEDNGITFGGWAQFGYTSQSTTLFNNQPDRINAHQIWLYAEKVADGSNGVDFGFRVDGMYGIDAGDTQSFGNDNNEWDFSNGFDRGAGYGFAIPQLYGEIAVDDLSVKVGHFYTLLGYEVVTAPDNFFYSHAFTMYNSEAFTHTGALATYAASDDMEVYAGWTLGWDTGFDQREGGNSFLGGFSTALADDLQFTYITTFGNFGNIGVGYSHSMVLDYAIADKWNFVAQTDLLDHGGNVSTGNAETETIGYNQYVFYEYSEKVKFGTRLEWWKSNGKSRNAVTYGVNVRPMDNLVLRPEVRYQRGSDPGLATITNDHDELIFGVDAVLTF